MEEFSKKFKSKVGRIDLDYEAEGFCGSLNSKQLALLGDVNNRKAKERKKIRVNPGIQN